jgi:hypothetical protein
MLLSILGRDPSIQAAEPLSGWHQSVVFPLTTGTVQHSDMAA